MTLIRFFRHRQKNSISDSNTMILSQLLPTLSFPNVLTSVEVSTPKVFTLDDPLTAILFPVAMLTCKTLLEKEINYWITVIDCFVNRPYDLDGDPKTHDWVMIFNTGSGEWECCSLTFNFGFRKRGNGAFVHHYDDDWNLIFTERIPFTRWRNTIKARIETPSLIKGLQEMIEKKV